MLLAQGGFSEGNMDLPVLLAPVHFEGASAHRPMVKVGVLPLRELAFICACVCAHVYVENPPSQSRVLHKKACPRGPLGGMRH
eukprot:scaffold67659_cov21-Tisochrysis_lutea.AAC.2